MNTEKSHRIGPESDETRRPDENHLTTRERAMLLERVWKLIYQ